MESFKTPEEREAEIDVMIERLAEEEGMEFEEFLVDITSFVPDEEEGDPHDMYLEIVAEKLGIPKEEMIKYALKKAGDFLEEEEEE